MYKRGSVFINLCMQRKNNENIPIMFMEISEKDMCII